MSAAGVGSKRSADDVNREGGAGTIRIRVKPPTQKAQDDYDDSGAEEEDAADSDDDEQEKDWTHLIAKTDHANRPIYVGAPPNRQVKTVHAFLERFSPFFKYAEELMITIAEPVSRCKHINEYVLTQHSLHAAVSIGMDTETIISRLRLFCKTELPDNITKFIRDATAVYGKVKMVIASHEGETRFYLETPRRDIYNILSKDPDIESAKTGHEGQGLLLAKRSGALPQGMQVLGKGPAAMGSLQESKADKHKSADAVADQEIARLEAYLDEDEGEGGKGAEDTLQDPTEVLSLLALPVQKHKY